MGTVKKFCITIVLNIFVMLLVTMLIEYANLSERFQQLDETMQLSLDSAIDTSIGSEELFANKDSNYVLSDSTDKDNVSKSLLVYGTANGGGSFFSVSPYVFAKEFNKYNNLNAGNKASVITRSNAMTLENLVYDTKSIYEFLYGDVGTDYNSSELSWANLNEDAASSYSVIGYGTNRTPTANFKKFFDTVGCKVTSTQVVKQNNGEYYDAVEREDIPVLANMGLNLDDRFNSTSSLWMTDNFCSSYHIGKRVTAGGETFSIYYLTPYSLGITYVPVEVLKPVFLATLDTNVRLQKLASGGISDTDVAQSMEVLDSATGCIGTEVYDNSNVSKAHKKASTEAIVNDGEIEYDLNSCKVRVEYFVVDYSDFEYNSTKQEILARVEGCISAYRYFKSVSPIEYKHSKSGLFYDNATTSLGSNFLDRTDSPRQRVIAKVSVRMKVHMCYDSSILQWLCYRFTGGATEHYDIKLFDEVNNKVSYEDDGIWCEYTSYRCHAR